MNYLTKTTFKNGIEIHAFYILKEGKVWLKEQWWHGDKMKEYHESEPWDTDNVRAVALRHDWNLYPDAMHMRT